MEQKKTTTTTKTKNKKNKKMWANNCAQKNMKYQ